MTSPGPPPSGPGTCLYEWSSTASSGNEQRPTATELLERAGATALPLNLAPEAVLDDGRRWGVLSADEQSRRRDLRAYYLAKAGAFAGAPDTSPSNPVRVVVLDDLEFPMAISAAGSELLSKASSCDNLHGVTVARVVQDVACGSAGANCNVEVWAYNALPVRLSSDAAAIERNPACSRVGDVVTFAQAVDRVIIDHRGFTGDIIVNASIGANLRGEPEAEAELIESLRKLACIGAVVVAATGNDLSTGAQAEDRNFKHPSILQGDVTATNCFPGSERSGITPRESLFEHILAVGGANARGPTMLTRSNGTLGEVDATSLGLSRFADNLSVLAYAQSVVASLGEGQNEVLLPPTSGASMATAVVSGAMAAVAGYSAPGELPSLISKIRDGTLALPKGGSIPVNANFTEIPFVSAFSLLEMTCETTCLSGLAVRPLPARPAPAYLKSNSVGTVTAVPEGSWPGIAAGWTVSETPLLGPEPPGIGACRECPLRNNELHLDYPTEPDALYSRGNYTNFFLQVRRDNVDELYRLDGVGSGALSLPILGKIDNAKLTATYVPTGQTVASEVEVHDPDAP